MEIQEMEKALLQELSGSIDSGEMKYWANDEYFFELIVKCFPIYGSKIDWDEVPQMIEKKIDQDNFIKSSLEFFWSNLPDKFHDSRIIYIGDNVTVGAYELPIHLLKENWVHFFEIPQHHYIIPLSSEWCMSFTMEGYLNFGHSASGREEK